MKRREFLAAAGALGFCPGLSFGQGKTSGYAEFATLEAELAKRGLKAADIEGIMGGNYIRVLRQAMTL